MISFRTKTTLLVLVCFSSACAPGQNVEEANYWQRANAPDAAYTQGPKVQQMLNRDIARCVGELNELERMGVLQDALPADRSQKSSNEDENTLRTLDTIPRDGYLLAEHRPYHDFESCMHAKSWERVQYMPYNVVDRAKTSFFSTLTHNPTEEDGRTKMTPKVRGADDLNE